MSKFQPKSPQDLAILKAGMCPDCGTGIFKGMTECKACGLTFEAYAHELPPQRAKAPPAPQAQQAPPQAQQAQQAPQAPPQAYAPPAQQQQQQQGYGPPPAQQQAQAPRAQAPMAPPPSAPGAPRPLTLEDIDAMERGPLQPSDFPLTDAEAPEYVRGASSPLLGSALQRAAIVVMADAAIVDDPLVLLGYPAQDTHVSRAVVNLRRSDAALTDDPQDLVASRGKPPINAASSSPASAPPAASAAQPSSAPRAAAPSAPSSTNAPGAGKPLSLDDIMALERPVIDVQPHSFAELADVPFAGPGAGDPLLGAGRIRGANAFMAEAAVIDDPLVLLGYPPVMSHVARQAINLKRCDAAQCDDIAWLLQRPAPAASGAPAVAPAAPRQAPQAPTSARSPVSGRTPDPEATALLDQNAVRAAAAAVAAEQEAAAQAQRRPPTFVSGRGGVRNLDDK